MENETSTVAAAVAVKPALNPRTVLVVVAGGIIIASVVTGVVKWKKSKDKKDAGGDEYVVNN